MLEYSEDRSVDFRSTDMDGDTVTIKREDYERLVYERDEYRSMCHDFAGRIPKFHKIHERINDILGGVTSE